MCSYFHNGLYFTYFSKCFIILRDDNGRLNHLKRIHGPCITEKSFCLLTTWLGTLKSNFIPVLIVF